MKPGPNLWERLKGETPKFFKVLIKIALGVAAVGFAILHAPEAVPGLVLSATVIEYCHYAIVAGIVATVVGKLPLTDNAIQNLKQ